jgi:hypothetical protein
MSDLVPCPGCNRHLKSEETTCPFCQAMVAPVAPESCTGRCARLSPARLTGAALVVAGAALLGAACESSQSAVPPYGIPPHFDAGTPVDSGGQTDAPLDAPASDRK